MCVIRVKERFWGIQVVLGIYPGFRILEVQVNFEGLVHIAKSHYRKNKNSKTNKNHISVISIYLSILSPIRGGAIIGVFMI
jgi:hypothetical protein